MGGKPIMYMGEEGTSSNNPTHKLPSWGSPPSIIKPKNKTKWH